ncbi:MAG TPA: glycosyltransferase [Gammaproteobacteria bacterium]
MKILYINSHSADYVQDLTYSGLVKLFGVKNVIDYHWNQKYHVPYKKYPKNLGYVTGSFLPSIVNLPVKHFDIVMVGSAKVDCFETYFNFMDKIPAAVPVVFIDGGDQAVIGRDLTIYGRTELYHAAIEKRPFDLMFKREMLIGQDYGENVFPLPMSFNMDRVGKLPTEKKYAVSFWAVESHPIRVQALDLLSPQFDCKANGTERNQKFSKYKRKGEFYLQELARCKIVLNFRGGGWDTMRYWEVPAVGSFMISQQPQFNIPNNFVNEQHVVFCRDDLSDLLELCGYYLKNNEARERIAANGKNHLLQYHTDVKRAEYIMQTIRCVHKNF